MFRSTTLALLFLLVSAPVLADEKEIAGSDNGDVEIPASVNIYSHFFRDALKGADVVAYHSLEPGQKAVKGSPDITYDWAYVTWRFATEENRDLFAADPEKYIPAYGGHCAYAMSRGFEAPPRPDSWTIIDSKLYLNNNQKSFEIWERDTEGNIDKANQNWVEINSGD
ncbi:YHS domain-containing (seleno)protein [Microbulbifer elongatus]|uniref:YHS domain-containing (seleno)protein n=1 Tax=Microbulbifer elongatus TaxID=86173 RepID=UPI001CFEC2B8|nr:YHS domain-containing (seleno)protein [Microbulbifer elongatus]